MDQSSEIGGTGEGRRHRRDGERRGRKPEGCAARTDDGPGEFSTETGGGHHPDAESSHDCHVSVPRNRGPAAASVLAHDRTSFAKDRDGGGRRVDSSSELENFLATEDISDDLACSPGSSSSLCHDRVRVLSRSGRRQSASRSSCSGIQNDEELINEDLTRA